MRLKLIKFYIPFLSYLTLIASNNLYAQHKFQGQIDNERWNGQVYLSVIEDFRTLENIDHEQIISKVETNADGFFQFEGNQLENQNKIYKLHVDSCSDDEKDRHHFNGHCNDSRDILFVANGNDTIKFPLGFEDQIFCDVRSTNPKTSALIKIDSLKEEMRFDYAEYRSKANRELNNKKWFKMLQDFGESLNEPLAELYIYAFLSDRSNNLHTHYLQDLKTNQYYDGLLERLRNKYPKSDYIIQYEAELNADKYIISGELQTSKKDNDQNPWTAVLLSVLFISIGLNIYLFITRKKQNQDNLSSEFKSNLTSQEQNVLDLLLENQSNKEIATTLFVSVSTVKSHINSIYKKLNVTSRDEAKNLFSK
ncbi:MAG: helix-turn-helix transcriptional regulator [Bacteroidota bacterium]